jgi:hypothetical protein
MMGSPASRCAASVGAAAREARRAPALSVVNAAIAASATVAGGLQRLITAVDCAAVNRFTITCPVEILSALKWIKFQIALFGTVVKIRVLKIGK